MSTSGLGSAALACFPTRIEACRELFVVAQQVCVCVRVCVIWNVIFIAATRWGIPQSELGEGHSPRSAQAMSGATESVAFSFSVSSSARRLSHLSLLVVILSNHLIIGSGSTASSAAAVAAAFMRRLRSVSSKSSRSQIGAAEQQQQQQQQMAATATVADTSSRR